MSSEENIAPELGEYINTNGSKMNKYPDEKFAAAVWDDEGEEDEEESKGAH